ncbi:YeiH family protein [Helicobacter cappadocius]|uniref:YeiH family protein n=1 Tax=Helicobacter cappadocius TaxID=3063998 RepID=A0AA90PIH8_9HELI|nr:MULTISPECIES: YeiH family protein [unclassified Helicobacter]MDO7252834.1 YeiH family protein [Helicobacter sp. faydin-H75]MDP2538877.1 YeiH family protein [Helicobacter sp. faydin-H76]
MSNLKKTLVVNSYFNGLVLVGAISFAALYFANLDFVQSIHFSPLLIGVVIGTLASSIFRRAKESTEYGVNFSAKKLLRFGIILYGFNVTLTEILSVGIHGIIISVIVVGVIFSLGTYIGVKFLGLDRDISMLVSGGSAVCGAAAVLALESSIKSEPYKGVIAVGTVVIFGLIAMFLYPILYNIGIIPLNHTQEGIYIGATVHEVANVVGASSSISPETESVAVTIKMIRVILLVPLLLIVPYLVNRDGKLGGRRKLHIPWFAFGFLVAVIINSYLPRLVPNVLSADMLENIIVVLRYICNVSLVFAMVALGLQVDLKKFASSGGKAFTLALILFVILICGGFFLVKFLI